ncbi:TPA: hypothetical protein HA244_05785 [Candidatus Micrarchaeota archaeon]|nr:hypothetical protein [Candidatus Micrarchaeota archaeon]
MVEVATVAYYLFLLVGGVGLGYFILRLTSPNARLYQPGRKLAVSALYGFALFAIGLGFDYYFSQENFLNAKGILPITVFATLIASLIILKIKNLIFKPKFTEVGVPVQPPPQTKAQPTAAMKTEENEERLKRRQMAESIVEEIRPEEEDKAMQKPTVEEIESKDESHRLYAQVAEEKKKEIEEKKSAESEMDQMAADVYAQLKVSSKRASAGQKIAIAPPAAEPKVRQKIAEQKALENQNAKPATAGEAIGISSTHAPKPTEPTAPSGSVFDRLSSLSSTTTQKTQEVKMVKVQESASCPRCHSPNSRIIFCPYCSSGMCANCSPLIKPTEEGFEYTCPNCGESVLVKKQAK